jgi:hypothetical protein
MTPQEKRIAIADDYTKDLARNRVRHAVRCGRIVKPTICPKCLVEYPLRLIHAHHHNGYDDWLDFVWLCYKCHDEVEPNAKRRMGNRLTDEQVATIRNSPEEGLLLASKFNVHPSTVSRIRKGKQRA